MVLPDDRGDRMTGPIATFEQFRDAVSAYRLPRVLLAALELDLFTAVGTQRWTIAALAKKMQVSERGLSILCRNLAMAGVLRKAGKRYANSRLGATSLNARHPAYRGAYLDMMKNHWSDWSRLPESVRSGMPIDHDVPDSPDYRRRFTWAMHDRTLETAPAIAAQLNLRRAKTLLDLGGGPGTYALAFLEHNPALQATVCDRQAALEVAQEIAATHRARRRLSYLPLDFSAEAIPGTYDIIWYSNVLHIYSPGGNQAIFQRALAALNPGGRLIIQDAFLHDREGLFPEDASLFAVSMLLFTVSGNTYTVTDTTRWLKAAGFARVMLRKMKKGREDWEDGILEAVAPLERSERPARRTRLTKSSRVR
ncbi:MAG: methyltransferase domain-containing protein [Nitrospiraceae bacterium]|nr:methyltransferase domain-containing protein [Nitrospiraceae bacterium]